LAEEVGSEALEFFDGIGGVEGAGGFAWRAADVGEACGDGSCGGVGGVDDGERVAERGEDALDGRLDERVVSAAEEESLCVGGGGESFGEVDLYDFVGDRVVDPALFYKGDEQGAGFFAGCQTEGVEGVGVGVGLDGGGGGENQDAVFGGDCWLFEQNAGVGWVGDSFFFTLLLEADSAAWAPGWTTPMTGIGRACWMSSRARAVAVLQAMTSSSAPCWWRNFALETA
jgi:hypothetical protein